MSTGTGDGVHGAAVGTSGSGGRENGVPSGSSRSTNGQDVRPSKAPIGLRHEPAHWHDYNTNVKMRWAGRSLLEVFVTEFRDRTSEYYQWAIHRGLCTVNGQRVSPHHILKQSDRIVNRVHRHEPCVTSDPIRVLHRDDEQGRLVVVKPGSIPVHPAGRYYKMTLLEMLKAEQGLDNVLPSNRLDRLTSGLMVCSTRKETAHRLSEQFAMGKVRKAYVCRVQGQFPSGETTVNEPLLHCDRQTGISVVHPLGKYSETIFNLLSYDQETDSSVVYCRPITGRTHQIRVHVQYLGHPIVNDPIYAHPLWKDCPPAVLRETTLMENRWKIEPGSTLSVYGSPELDRVVEGLKLDKDGKDDWARWRDEILFSRLLEEEGVERIVLPGFNAQSPAAQRERAQIADEMSRGVDETQYCQECMIPLLPDPDPEELFIYLHAIKYQTDDWTYEDQLPWWALSNWRKAKGSAQDPADTVMPPAFGLVGRGSNQEEEQESVVDMPDMRALVRVSEKLASEVETVDNKVYPRVVLQVMGGMDDFAVADLERQLSDATGTPCRGMLAVQVNTGHVYLPAGNLSFVGLTLYNNGDLLCVKDAYIEIASPAMPSTIMSALAQEKKELTEARRLSNYYKKQQKKQEGDGPPSEAQEEEAVKSEMTTNEKLFLEAIQEAWNALVERCDASFAVWKATTGFDASKLDRKPRFRATVDRRGFTLPTLTSAQMERLLGDLVWNWLNGVIDDDEEGEWDVDLMAFDLDVQLKLIPGHQDHDDQSAEPATDAVDPHWRTKEANVPGRFAFLFACIPKRLPEHRLIEYPNHIVHNSTALARHRAYILAVALPLLASDGGALQIWEPCVGCGSIAIELWAALKRRGIKSTLFASDISSAEVDKAQEMVDLCCGAEATSETESQRILLGTVDAMDLEASAVFVGSASITSNTIPKDGSLDGIVTDLPWGRRVLNHATIAKLYPALLRCFAYVLKPYACALLMTAEHKTLVRAVKAHEAEARRKAWPFLLTVERIDVDGPVPHNGDDSDRTAPTDEQRAAHVRTVECGYMVSVVLLRKRPMFK